MAIAEVVALTSAIFVFLAFLASGPGIHLKIHKGITAPDKYNFAVLIIDDQYNICTGFILDDSTIGTAGHCTVGK